MKNTISKKIIIVSLIMCISLSLFSCNSKKEKNGPIVHPISVTISIDFPEKAKIPDIINAEFSVEEGSSVLDLTQLYCNVNDIPVTVETTNNYIQGIDNVINDYFIKGKSWVYTINNEYSNKSQSEYAVKDGDSIQWKFIRTQGQK
ncbi:MAG: DUF4430 domain-containing protein [Eubacteriales bacterium]|nr:DUF4430 domain-containing protein [Eubacteriales bacterium]